jgi:dihydroorotase
LYDLILRDATIVTSTGRLVADIAIRDGEIVYVGPRPRRAGRQDISAIGKFAMPGVIDTGGLFDGDGGNTAWEHETKAAVSGGITTVIGMPYGSKPIVDSKSAIARAKKMKKHSWCNYGFWVDGDVASTDTVREVLDEGNAFGVVINLTQDNEAEAAARLTELVGVDGVLAVRLGRTSRDAGGINAVLAVAREHNRHIHIAHLSTADELSALDPVLGELPVSCSVTPYHLFLSTDHSNPGVSLPPVRPEQDRRTLWTALRRGRVACMASDHHTSPAEGPGIPGAEFLFPLLLSAVRHGRLSLEGLVALTSEGPAALLGLPKKGRIEKGADADIVLFSEGELTKVRPASVLSGAGWSPYLGRESAPKPELVIVNGRIASRKGIIAQDKPNGVLLSPPTAVPSK